MTEYKQVIIEALKKHHDNAMANAKEFRARAQREPTQAEAQYFLNQAEKEEAKARDYLNHAEILSRTNDL